MTETAKALLELPCRIAAQTSAIHGKGLFAVVQAIRKVEIVCVKGGHIFDRQKLREITTREQ